jgi:PAS domain S-box-containing protein
MAEMLGYTVGEMLGHSLFDFMDGAARAEAERSLERRKQGITEQHDFRFRCRNGADLWTIVSTNPILNETGEFAGALAMITDVTERKRLEEELRQRAEALAEADRRKDEFLAMLAHELRNPLAAIWGALHLARVSETDELRRQTALDAVERQVRHQTRLVDDLLDVSRITRGKIVLRPERLDLARLLRESVQDHRRALEAASLHLALVLPEQSVWVNGDATRLAQVVSNLLQNAAKFTDPGGRVTVRLEVEDQAVITVRDTGIGITPEMVSHLFEPLTQADRTLDRSRGGLGLGLALVKGLVELHGGEVGARSDGPGCGATFTVELPWASDPAAPPAATTPSRAAAPNGAAFGRRILVVEDNHDVAEALCGLLQLYGHQVEVASCGRDGVAAARRLRPEVVLCDIGLPGMDGYAVARALRRDPSTAGARLIAVSGYGMDEDRKRSEEAGFELHLTKPVRPADLQRLLAAD